MSLVAAEEEIILGPDAAGILMTPEEFDAVQEYDENYLYELVHGVLVVTPIPLGEEKGPNELLGHLLLDYQEKHPQGSALDDTLPQQYVRTRTSRRLADRLIWTGLGRLANRSRDLPTIAVEFVSSARRDRLRDYVEKLREYMELGIQEYWIIDRFRRTLTVFRNRPKRPVEIVIRENENYTTSLLPGFELPLSRILEIADKMARASQTTRIPTDRRRKP